MDQDDHVCLCYRVSLRKIQTYLRCEDPPVASLISECLDAGTGCGWCVPFLNHLHDQHTKGVPVDLSISPEAYMKSRGTFKATGERTINPAEKSQRGGDDSSND
ncbi:MAG: (2Fe-2S)-binding protein [Phycisphaera sp.]|nr:MAG: (2Fe-2S)-binding protein [Phycisphaera sp.]